VIDEETTMNIRHVLVPVDLSPLSLRSVELGIEVCRAFGARLVLHHNQHGAPPAMARGWDWEEQHRGTQGRTASVESALRDLERSVPTEVPVDIAVTRGVALPAILALAESIPADLVIVASHGGDSDDHSSIVQRLIGQAPCPVLALQEGMSQPGPLHLLDGGADVVVPTDFSPASRALLGYVFALARVLPLRLRLLHVVAFERAPSLMPGDVVGALDAVDLESEARARLYALVPPDLVARVSCAVAVGPAAGGIVAACGGVDFLIMGEHARGLRGFFTHDTARDVLRHAPCPVWFVPPRLAA